MKQCSICKTEKELDDFYRAARAKDGRQSACKLCANTQNVSSMKKKPAKYAALRRKTQAGLTERFKKWKEAVGCAFCDEREPICLELHHKDPSQKEIQPNKLRNYSWERFMREAHKCIMVCSNCHKKIHGGIIDDSNTPTIGEQSA